MAYNGLFLWTHRRKQRKKPVLHTDQPKVSSADETSLPLVNAGQLSFVLRVILLKPIPIIRSYLCMYKYIRMFVKAVYVRVFGELFINKTPGHTICISKARENRFSKGIASLAATVRYCQKFSHMLTCTYAPHSIVSLSKHRDWVTCVLDGLCTNIFCLPVDHPRPVMATFVQTENVCIWNTGESTLVSIPNTTLSGRIP